MYQVFENDKPVEYSNSYKEWQNSKFKTFEQTVEYARQWLGPIWDNSKHIFKLNEPYYYYTDSFIVIKEINIMKIAQYEASISFEVLIQDDEDEDEYQTRVTIRDIENQITKLFNAAKHLKNVNVEITDVNTIYEKM